MSAMDEKKEYPISPYLQKCAEQDEWERTEGVLLWARFIRIMNGEKERRDQDGSKNRD